MSPDRWADLRARAGEATPGPWVVDPPTDDPDDGNWAIVRAEPPCWVVAQMVRGIDGDPDEANAAYIAAASPAAVLALLAERDALRAALREIAGMPDDERPANMDNMGSFESGIRVAASTARAALAAGEDAP